MERCRRRRGGTEGTGGQGRTRSSKCGRAIRNTHEVSCLGPGFGRLRSRQIAAPRTRIFPGGR